MVITQEASGSLLDTFKALFKAVGEPFPDPAFTILTGYHGPTPQDGAKPQLRLHLAGTRVDVSASVAPQGRVEEITKRGKRWTIRFGPPGDEDNREEAERRWQEFTAGPGETIVESSDGKMEQWKGIFNKKELWEILQNQFTSTSPELQYNLELRLSSGGHLEIEHPSGRLRISP